MRVLLVKLSSLGDVVHTLPVVHDISQAYPGVHIDWVVEKGFAPLVSRCVGIDRVIPCELRRWRHAPWRLETRMAWREFRTALQQESYDAVIDLQGLSKSALVSWMARCTPNGKRYALANRTEGSGYEAPTRWAADVLIPIEPHVHAVMRGRLMCAQALGYRMSDHEVFGLETLDESGKSAIENEAIKQVQPLPCVALVHGTSRADKEWPMSHWLSLGQKLRAAGYRLAWLHGSDAEQQRSEQLASQLPGSTVWPRLSLDGLTDAMAHCAGVIGVDSGVSHIAVALDLPHVQIYNFDTAWRTGPVNRAHQRSIVGQPTPSVDAVWDAWQLVEKPVEAA